MNATLKLEMPTVRAICEKYGVRELRLFGSALGPTFRAESDVDFLVEFQPDVRMGLITFLKMRDELQDLIGRPVDLVQAGGLKATIRDEVLANNELLYAA
ncbi:nucleotidyltransferase [Candidatus Koribacter versatilis Ellin345]|uniref:Nucleotidyltransferase n=1 Tax=Koribacter versatilis (strain Ellin345) TaxID=204669 RepID=Q1IQ81_KORVE|nr:nucleotidyltransferase domain-containing protein [Candidatus Koribacter versatilis]ABF40969.1 nucleotidyltransferase [Candidatus Koribacter versatilis Ellin345]